MSQPLSLRPIFQDPGRLNLAFMRQATRIQRLLFWEGLVRVAFFPRRPRDEAGRTVRRILRRTLTMAALEQHTKGENLDGVRAKLVSDPLEVEAIFASWSEPEEKLGLWKALTAHMASGNAIYAPILRTVACSQVLENLEPDPDWAAIYAPETPARRRRGAAWREGS